MASRHAFGLSKLTLPDGTVIEGSAVLNANRLLVTNRRAGTVLLDVADVSAARKQSSKRWLIETPLGEITLKREGCGCG
jgi:hypothetical protein